MSDDVLSVPTPFQDVATLAQGYMNRADGERLLLPLSVNVGEGQGVRFVVALADGTPAFAGAGRASQISDQGEAVPPESRYETLLEALQFDERSQPVYDYIVAVRSAAYAQPTEAEAEAVEGEPAEGSAYEEAGFEEVEQGEAVEYDVDDGGFDEEATAYIGPPQGVSEAQEAPAEAYAQPEEAGEVYVQAEGYGEPAEEYAEQPAEALAYAEQPAEALAYAEQPAEALAYTEQPVEAVAYAEQPVEAVAYAEQPAEAAAYAEPELAVASQPQSLTPELIPTGMLTRPALGVHWAPAPPRRPTPRPSSGLFQYNGGGLPAPAAAPRPELDPMYWVARAPHPSDQAAAQAQAAEAPPAEPSYQDEGHAAEPTYAQEALSEGEAAGFEAAAAPVEDTGHEGVAEASYAEASAQESYGEAPVEAEPVGEEGLEAAADVEAAPTEAAVESTYEDDADSMEVTIDEAEVEDEAAISVAPESFDEAASDEAEVDVEDEEDDVEIETGEDDVEIETGEDEPA